ncbi:MAG: T9SS type A sorting domain-containing protein [Bacteroidia bacterium]
MTYLKQIFFTLGLFAVLTLSAQSNPPIKLYPNPASSFIRVEFNTIPSSPIQINISDILGNKIKTYNFNQDEFIEIDLSGLNLINGLYLVKVETENSMIIKRLIIKNK